MFRSWRDRHIQEIWKLKFVIYGLGVAKSFPYIKHLCSTHIKNDLQTHFVKYLSRSVSVFKSLILIHLLTQFYFSLHPFLFQKPIYVLEFIKKKCNLSILDLRSFIYFTLSHVLRVLTHGYDVLSYILFITHDFKL